MCNPCFIGKSSGVAVGHHSGNELAMTIAATIFTLFSSTLCCPISYFDLSSMKPKKDPRSKLHIQGKNQKKNLEFIMEKLAMFYFEVCVLDENISKAIVLKDLQRAHCLECGKIFVNRSGNLFV